MVLYCDWPKDKIFTVTLLIKKNSWISIMGENLHLWCQLNYIPYNVIVELYLSFTLHMHIYSPATATSSFGCLVTLSRCLQHHFLIFHLSMEIPKLSTCQSSCSLSIHLWLHLSMFQSWRSHGFVLKVSGCDMCWKLSPWPFWVRYSWESRPGLEPPDQLWNPQPGTPSAAPPGNPACLWFHMSSSGCSQCLLTECSQCRAQSDLCTAACHTDLGEASQASAPTPASAGSAWSCKGEGWRGPGMLCRWSACRAD